MASAYASPDNGSGGSSANWAGYAKSGQTYDFVTATWVEPAMPVPCAFGSSGPSLAFFHVGLDGFGNATSEMVGTGLECIPAAPPPFSPSTPMVVKHAGFYQISPSTGGPPFGIPFCNPEDATPARGCVSSFDLKAGDRVTAGVSYAGGTFTFWLFNWRTYQSASVTGTNASATRTSAEAVAEAFAGAPLTNFGKVSFRGFFAGTSDRDDLFDGTWKSTTTAITMSSAGHHATPGPLSYGSFNVNWSAS